MVIIEPTFTGTFTCLLDVTTTYASGISSYNLVLTASNFTSFTAFQALFQYYTPKRLDAHASIRNGADTGLLVRVRPLHPVSDAAYSTSVISPANLVADPTTVQCTTNGPTSTPTIRYKDAYNRLACSGASSAKLAEINIVLPVAQDPSGTATTVVILHMVATFYRQVNA